MGLKGVILLMIIIDMFSRWIEPFPCAYPDALTVAKALVKEILPRFGVPERTYSVNGIHFVNQIIQRVSKTLCIQLKNHFASQPPSAGFVERNNGPVKNKLKRQWKKQKEMGVLPPSGVTEYADNTH